jgi:hypothetical protein
MNRVNSFSLFVAASAVALACFSMLGGCGTREFSAPSEAGKYGAQPLAVPVLSAIDPGVENGEYDFAHATDPTPEDQKSTKGDYAVEKNDLLNIAISDLYGPSSGETVKVVRVDKQGDIHLPLIEPLHAAGLNEIELEQAIVEAYRKAGIIENAQVSISD